MDQNGCYKKLDHDHDHATKWIWRFFSYHSPATSSTHYNSASWAFPLIRKTRLRNLGRTCDVRGHTPWLKLEAASNHPGEMEKWTVHRISTVKSPPALNFIASWFQQNMQKTIPVMFLHVFWHRHGAHQFFSVLLSRTKMAIAGMLPTTNWKTY